MYLLPGIQGHSKDNTPEEKKWFQGPQLSALSWDPTCTPILSISYVIFSRKGRSGITWVSIRHSWRETNLRNDFVGGIFRGPRFVRFIWNIDWCSTLDTLLSSIRQEPAVSINSISFIMVAFWFIWINVELSTVIYLSSSRGTQKFNDVGWGDETAPPSNSQGLLFISLPRLDLLAQEIAQKIACTLVRRGSFFHYTCVF